MINSASPFGGFKHFMNGTTTNPYNPNNTIIPGIVLLHKQHSPILIFIDDNTPAHLSLIIRERLLETRVPWLVWPALSPDLNPVENLWDHQSFCVDAFTSESQWPKDCLSKRTGSHTSGDKMTTCEQMSLSSCKWCSWAHNMLLRRFLLWHTHH